MERLLGWNGVTSLTSCESLANYFTTQLLFLVKRGEWDRLIIRRSLVPLKAFWGIVKWLLFSHKFAVQILCVRHHLVCRGHPSLLGRRPWRRWCVAWKEKYRVLRQTEERTRGQGGWFFERKREEERDVERELGTQWGRGLGWLHIREMGLRRS